jgi:hypothetical protein
MDVQDGVWIVTAAVSFVLCLLLVLASMRLRDEQTKRR